MNMVKKKFGQREITSWEGSKNMAELKQWLAGMYIKFTLDELEDLPDIVYEEVVVKAKEAKELDVDLESGWQTMELGEPPSAHIMAIKMENALLKVPAAIDIVENLISNGQGPVVVFSDHREPAKLVAEAIKGGVYIRGDTPLVERNRIVIDFQAGKIPVLAGTIGAMGVGLTLTASNVMVFIDRSYTPGNNIQAVRRIQRVSQKRRCRVIELSRKGIDQKINKVLREKEAIISEVMSGN